MPRGHLGADMGVVPFLYARRSWRRYAQSREMVKRDAVEILSGRCMISPSRTTRNALSPYPLAGRMGLRRGMITRDINFV